MDSQARLTAFMVEVMVVLTILVVNLLWREIVNVVCRALYTYVEYGDGCLF